MGFGNREYSEIVEQFINSGKSDIDRLQSAIEEGNAVKAAEAAHSLKGASIIVGLTEIYEIARGIEEKSRNDQLTEAAAAVQNLKGKFARVCESIKQRDGCNPAFQTGKSDMKKILVVDNHPAMLKLMTHILENEGHQIFAAKDGLTALNILETYIPDVVFIDLVMPNISGDKLCQIIRSMPEMAAVYIVILSAIAAEDEVDFVKLGANACIAKGPMNKMSAQVIGLLDQLSLKAGDRVAGEIKGLEYIQERHITKELLSFKRHLSIILDSMSEGIVEITVDRKIIYANPAAVSLVGIPETTLLASNFTDVFDASHGRKVHEVLNGASDPKPAVVTDLPTRNGKQISLKIQPVQDERLTYIIIMDDVTEKKQAEKSLLRSEEKYRNILESIKEGYFEVDVAGNLTFFNDSLCAMSGYSRDELMGMNNRDYTTLETARKMYQVFNRIYQTGAPAELTGYEIVGGDGKKRNFEMSSSLMIDQAGRSIGFRGLVRDVSDRLKAHKEKEMLQAQLRRTQKMEAIGTLAGGISHDFNNILQAISGYTQILLMDKRKDDPDYGKLTEIDKTVQRAGDLTRRLLIFGRKVESELRPVDLRQQIRHALKLIERTIPKMVDIKLHLGEDAKIINADPVQLEQILMNLGINARDAMPDGGNLTFEIKNVVLGASDTDTQLGCTPGEYVRLIVSDTGCGMEKEVIEHIFEPFFTTKGTEQGSGLGLAMVYGIVKNHGGFITCSSEPEQGATFEIYFPALTSQEKAVGSDTEEDGELPGGSETILLVDDDEIILKLGVEVLEKQGYTIIKAKNGEEAIDIYSAKKDRIDLLILDLNMPGMGGNKCLGELLIIDPKVKVVIASGYSDTKRVRETLESGAAGFIRKPYQVADMLKKIRSVLDNRIQA
ncbi:MAG: response regulator [Deltaproteobacteria bacterium]|nr:response regulator [Deltaproteobacteria bacterium]